MQRYFAQKREGNTFLLKEEDYYHIFRVMRGKELDEIEVVFENCVYLCVLKQVSTTPKIEIVRTLEVGEKEREMILCIPYLKETKLDFYFTKGNGNGSDEVYFLSCKVWSRKDRGCEAS